MHIVFDYQFYGEPYEVRHTFDTDDPFAVTVIRSLISGAKKLAGTGWEEPTNHPNYKGKTRLDALVGELKKEGITL